MHMHAYHQRHADAYAQAQKAGREVQSSCDSVVCDQVHKLSDAAKEVEVAAAKDTVHMRGLNAQGAPDQRRHLLALQRSTVPLNHRSIGWPG